jgi:hypothetical protein
LDNVADIRPYMAEARAIISASKPAAPELTKQQREAIYKAVVRRELSQGNISALAALLDTHPDYPAAQPAVDAGSERDAFEAWCDRNEYNRTKRLDGSGYVYDATNRAWAAWQARAAASAQATGQVVAWIHVDDQREAISDLKKRDMIEFNGTPGRKAAEKFSIPCYATPSPDGAQKDAERYRFLRSQPPSVEPERIDVVYWSALDESANEGEALRGDALDAAIDAAITASAKKEAR